MAGLVAGLLDLGGIIVGVVGLILLLSGVLGGSGRDVSFGCGALAGAALLATLGASL